MKTIKAKEGYTFIRVIDGFEMGDIIHLGIDYSTGEPREDKEEYYTEVLIDIEDSNEM